MALASCVSEDLSKAGGKDTGRLQIGVETQEPLKTRAGEYTVTNYPVTIYEADGTTKVTSYDAVSAMPAQILLPTGNYVLESHTPGVMERIMTAPYYKGTENSTITKDVTTQSTITCRMANTSITVHYDQEFLDLFTSWSVTFDDGQEQALSFTNEDGDTPATLYWDLGDGAEKLTINFRGVNKDGTVTASNVLTKSQATESYDGETTFFTGGDAVVVNFTPTEATSGYITVAVTAEIFGTNAESVPATVEIVDNGTFTPDDGNGEEPGPGPEPNDDAIKLTLPAPLVFAMGEGATLDPALGDVHIEAEKGIKSLLVIAESTSEDMTSSLELMGGGYGLDFLNAGVEVVGNTDLVNFFTMLGKNLSVPTEGDTTYDFPVGNFFSLLDVMAGTHTFHLTATDMEGNTKTGAVVITVNE